jgi:hypothetical protein
MVILETQINVPDLSAKSVFDFMIDCTDEKYQQWWPKTHLAFHTISRQEDNIGSLVLFDEMIGKRRLMFQAMIIKSLPRQEIVWQMKKMILLPAWLSLKFQNTEDGVLITHSLSAGFRGLGKVFDPIIRLYLNKKFEKELAAHANMEFNKLSLLVN